MQVGNYLYDVWLSGQVQLGMVGRRTGPMAPETVQVDLSNFSPLPEGGNQLGGARFDPQTGILEIGGEAGTSMEAQDGGETVPAEGSVSIQLVLQSQSSPTRWTLFAPGAMPSVRLVGTGPDPVGNVLNGEAIAVSALMRTP